MQLSTKHVLAMQTSLWTEKSLDVSDHFPQDGAGSLILSFYDRLLVMEI